MLAKRTAAVLLLGLTALCLAAGPAAAQGTGPDNVYSAQRLSLGPISTAEQLSSPQVFRGSSFLSLILAWTEHRLTSASTMPLVQPAPLWDGGRKWRLR